MSGMSSDGEDNILQDESDDGSDGDGMFGYNFLSYPTSISNVYSMWQTLGLTNPNPI